MISAPLLRVPAAAAPFRLRASPSSGSRPSNVRCASASASSTVASTLYDVLGLRAGATAREIKAAYRRLARERHPDVAPGASSADEFVRLHDAYATLSDPDSRARYDRAAVAQRPRTGWGAARPRRTWETDQCW